MLSVHDLRDVEVLERTPLHTHCQARCSYEALQASAGAYPSKSAIRFFLDGECHDPGAIPWRARLRALGARLRYREAVATPYEDCSFGELFERVNRTARLLQSCGVGRDDVVSLLLPNLPETLVCMWAAETVGVVNPINPLLEAGVIEGILRAANTKVLVTLGDLPGVDIWAKVKGLRQRVPSLQTIIVVKGDAPPECIRLRSALARFSPAPLTSAELPAPGQVAALFHTGGTTGFPKLVRGTHWNRIANVQMLLLVSPLKSTDTGLVILPLFHVNAAINCLLTVMMGMTCVLAGPSGFRTPRVRERFWDIVRVHEVSFFSAVPTVFSALLQLPPPRTPPVSVKFAISAAAPMPVEVQRGFTQRTGIPVLEGYGQTEATVATCLTPFGGQHKVGAVGLRLPYAKVRVALLGARRELLRACAPNEIGQLLVAGDHVSAGYLNPEHDRELWTHDAEGQRWLISGDLARVDDDGYVWITGRAKELIIRGGHNIDPRMIEEAMQSHPEVVGAAAVGRPDAHLGEVPVVYVTLRRDARADGDALMQHAERSIPERAAVPKAIRIVDELPLTPVGKVYKPQLLEREQEAVYRDSLSAVVPRVEQLSVQVRPHSEHGLMTTIQMKLRASADRDWVTGQVASAMRPFAARYNLNMSE